MYRIIYIIKGLFEFIFLRRILKQKKYNNVKPFKVLGWHHGVTYFICSDNKNNKYFIKSSGIYSAAEREFRSLTAINDISLGLVPTVVDYIAILNNSFVVMEFCKGEVLTKKNCQDSAFRRFILEVVPTLSQAQIIHRDIRPENIIISKGNFILIDFGWAVIEGDDFNDKNYLDSLITLGGKYKPSQLEWDDSYSLNAIYKEFYGKTLDIESSISHRYKTQ